MTTVAQAALYAKQSLSYKKRTAEELLNLLITKKPTVFCTIRERGKWDDPGLKGKRIRLTRTTGGKKVVIADAQISEIKTIPIGKLSATDQSRLPDPLMPLEERIALMRSMSSHPLEFTADTSVAVITLINWNRIAELDSTTQGKLRRRDLGREIELEKTKRYEMYKTMTSEKLEQEAERVAEDFDSQWNADFNGPVIDVTGHHDEEDKEVPLKFSLTVHGLSEWDLENLFDKNFPFGCLEED